MTDQLAPDAAQIRLHLEILFSDLDALGPYPEGLFELRFLPHNGGKPICKLFSWGDIDKAVEMAERANANGMNGYVGVHPRKPGTSRAGQASDVDRAYCQFVDCDDGEASAKLLKLPFSPNFIVTTGTRPTQRLHGYYMLDAARDRHGGLHGPSGGAGGGCRRRQRQGRTAYHAASWYGQLPIRR